MGRAGSRVCRLARVRHHSRWAAPTGRPAPYPARPTNPTPPTELTTEPRNRSHTNRIRRHRITSQGAGFTSSQIYTGNGTPPGALDLAFVGLPVASTSVTARLIRREPFGAVLPLDHRLASEREIDLRELADDGFVTTPLSAGSALQESAMRACVDAGFRSRVVQEITDPYMILMLVAAGVGVALMTSGVADITPPGTVFVALPGDATYT